jgi:hypothetical protein
MDVSVFHSKLQNIIHYEIRNYRATSFDTPSGTLNHFIMCNFQKTRRIDPTYFKCVNRGILGSLLCLFNLNCFYPYDTLISRYPKLVA